MSLTANMTLRNPIAIDFQPELDHVRDRSGEVLDHDADVVRPPQTVLALLASLS